MVRLEAIFALIAAGIGATGALFAKPAMLGIAVAVALVVTTMRILDPARKRKHRHVVESHAQPAHEREHEVAAGAR
jgi:hypothetical protein